MVSSVPFDITPASHMLSDGGSGVVEFWRNGIISIHACAMSEIMREQTNMNDLSISVKVQINMDICIVSHPAVAMPVSPVETLATEKPVVQPLIFLPP